MSRILVASSKVLLSSSNWNLGKTEVISWK